MKDSKYYSTKKCSAVFIHTHSLYTKTAEKAIKLKADKDPGRVIYDLDDINDTILSDTGIQKFYYDIIASHAFCLDVAYQQFNLLN